MSGYLQEFYSLLSAWLVEWAESFAACRASRNSGTVRTSGASRNRNRTLRWVMAQIAEKVPAYSTFMRIAGEAEASGSARVRSEHRLGVARIWFPAIKLRPSG